MAAGSEIVIVGPGGPDSDGGGGGISTTIVIIDNVDLKRNTFDIFPPDYALPIAPSNYTFSFDNAIRDITFRIYSYSGMKITSIKYYLETMYTGKSWLIKEYELGMSAYITMQTQGWVTITESSINQLSGIVYGLAEISTPTSGRYNQTATQLRLKIIIETLDGKTLSGTSNAIIDVVEPQPSYLRLGARAEDAKMYYLRGEPFDYTNLELQLVYTYQVSGVASPYFSETISLPNIRVSVTSTDTTVTGWHETTFRYSGYECTRQYYVYSTKVKVGGDALNRKQKIYIGTSSGNRIPIAQIRIGNLLLYTNND